MRFLFKRLLHFPTSRFGLVAAFAAIVGICVIRYSLEHRNYTMQDSVLGPFLHNTEFEKTNTNHEMQFSEDGSHVAYSIPVGDKEKLVVDGTVGTQQYDWIEDIVFRPHSSEVAHFAVNITGKEAYGVRTQTFFVLDGKTVGGPYAESGELHFTSDGKHLVYYAVLPGAISADEQKGQIVIDGKAGTPFDELGQLYAFINSGALNNIRGITLSPDGRHFGFSVRRGGQWIVDVDGRDGKEYDDIKNRAVAIGDYGRFINNNVHFGLNLGLEDNALVSYETAPIFGQDDSDRTGYIAKKGSKWVVVVDGQEGTEYDEVFGPVSPLLGLSRGHVAYCASRDGKFVVVIDGQEIVGYDSIGRKSGFTFSPDDEHVAFAAAKAGKWFVVLDGKPLGPYDGLKMEGAGGDRWGPWGNDDYGKDLVFNADGKLAYFAQKGEKFFAVVDGLPGKNYDGAAQLTFSRDGHRLAYIAIDNNQEFVVVDGQEGPRYEGIVRGSLLFSSNGKHFAYAALRGKNQLEVIDGMEVGNFYQQPSAYSNFHKIQPSIFSKDGKHVGYLVNEDGKKEWVIDGVKGSPYDDILDFQFSPDGKHFSCAAETNGVWRVIIDGKLGPSLNRILTGPTFHSDGTLVCLGVRVNNLVRVTGKP
jgi:hypothetical protein